MFHGRKVNFPSNCYYAITIGALDPQEGDFVASQMFLYLPEFDRGTYVAFSIAILKRLFSQDLRMSRLSSLHVGKYLQIYCKLMMCLIGTNSENGRLGRLGTRVLLTPKYRKRQAWQVWKACETFCSERQKVWQISGRFSFSFLKF